MTAERRPSSARADGLTTGGSEPRPPVVSTAATALDAPIAPGPLTTVDAPDTPEHAAWRHAGLVAERLADEGGDASAHTPGVLPACGSGSPGEATGALAFREAPAAWSVGGAPGNDLAERAKCGRSLAPATGHGLILLAIDDFAAIGGLFGEDVAIALAYAAEARLWSGLPEGAGSWPAGRGQFAIILPGVTAQALLAAARMLQTRIGSTPLIAPSGEVEVTASAGCAMADAAALPHLGASAARALAEAQARGRGRAILLPAEPDRQGERLRTAQRALARGALALTYQPVLPLRTDGPALYAECLVSLPGGEDGAQAPLPAEAFLPGLQAAGEAQAVDRFVLDAALTALRADPRLRLGINLSAETLRDRAWHDMLTTGCCAGAGTDQDVTADGPRPLLAERLVVEIDAAALADDPVAVGAFAERLRDSGVAIAIDRYTAGLLDLRLVESLRPDFLKLALNVPRFAGQRDDMLRPGLAIADRNDITTIATGLEDPQSVATARSLGIAFGQGFYLAQPALTPPETVPGTESVVAPLPFRSVRGKALRSGSASR